MNIINIKPLSVNQAWQGKRFKTKAYKGYEAQIISMLPAISIPDGNLIIKAEWGLSSKNADVDNPLKCFVDCLQKKYGFNDRRVYRMEIEKKDVKKGNEYIAFSISRLD